MAGLNDFTTNSKLHLKLNPIQKPLVLILLDICTALKEGISTTSAD